MNKQKKSIVPKTDYSKIAKARAILILGAFGVVTTFIREYFRQRAQNGSASALTTATVLARAVIWIGVTSTSHKKAAKQNYEVCEAFVWIRKRVE
jgi:hypothetical protein